MSAPKSVHLPINLSAYGTLYLQTQRPFFGFFSVWNHSITFATAFFYYFDGFLYNYYPIFSALSLYSTPGRRINKVFHTFAHNRQTHCNLQCCHHKFRGTWLIGLIFGWTNTTSSFSWFTDFEFNQEGFIARKVSVKMILWGLKELRTDMMIK